MTVNCQRVSLNLILLFAPAIIKKGLRSESCVTEKYLVWANSTPCMPIAAHLSECYLDLKFCLRSEPAWNVGINSSLGLCKSSLNANLIVLFHKHIIVPLNSAFCASRGAVCNVLLTCCKDSVCRLWAETLLPSDCLLSGLRQSYSSNNNDTVKSSNIKKAHHNNKGHSRPQAEVSDTSTVMKRRRNWVMKGMCAEHLMYVADLNTSNYEVEFQKRSAVSFVPFQVYSLLMCFHAPIAKVSLLC